MINHSNPQYLFDWACDIGKTHPFYDFHVHPFDIFSTESTYQSDDTIEGVFNNCASAYHPPKKTITSSFLGFSSESTLSSRSLLLSARLSYTHIGPKVIIDQLDEAGLGYALLLPVARTSKAVDKISHELSHFFPGHQRLIHGCAFPVGVPKEKLSIYLQTEYKAKGFHAIKLHPNLSEIDPLTDEGKLLIEELVISAGSLNIPIVIHGGRSFIFETDSMREFGTLFHLSNINWNLASAPVILAHCGLYHLEQEEVADSLVLLNTLFEKYPKLKADTSNLGPHTLQLVLKTVDRSRLLFGSDGLYIPIWKAWIGFLIDLFNVSQKFEEDLIRIASINPLNCLGI